MTDDAVEGQAGEADVSRAIALISLSRLAGTILEQAMLLAAESRNALVAVQFLDAPRTLAHPPGHHVARGDGEILGESGRARTYADVRVLAGAAVSKTEK